MRSLLEILRMYPPLPFLDRECTVPADEKGYALDPYTDFVIPRGMPVLIPVYAIHRDPKVYKKDISPANFLLIMLSFFSILPNQTVFNRIDFRQKIERIFCRTRTCLSDWVRTIVLAKGLVSCRLAWV